MSKDLKILTLVALTLVVGGTAGWLLRGQQIIEPVGVLIPHNDVTRQQANVPAANEASQASPSQPIPNWKTYKGLVEGVNYEISYPADWRIVEKSSGGVGFGPKDLLSDIIWEIDAESVKARKTSTVIADIKAEYNRNGNEVTTKNITVDGKAAVLIDVSKPDTDFSAGFVVLEYKGVVFTLSKGPALIGESFVDFYKSFKVR